MTRYKLLKPVLELIKKKAPVRKIRHRILKAHAHHSSVIGVLGDSIGNITYLHEMEILACFATKYGHTDLLLELLYSRQQGMCSDSCQECNIWTFNPLLTALQANNKYMITRLVHWNVPSAMYFNDYQGVILRKQLLEMRHVPMSTALEADDVDLMVTLLPTYNGGHGSCHIMYLATLCLADDCMDYIIEHSSKTHGSRVLGESVPIGVSSHEYNVLIPDGSAITALTNLVDEPFYMQLNLPCLYNGYYVNQRSFWSFFTQVCNALRCRTFPDDPIIPWHTFNRLQRWLHVYGKNWRCDDVTQPLQLASRMCDALLLCGVEHYFHNGRETQSLLDSFLYKYEAGPQFIALATTLKHIRQLLIHGSLTSSDQGFVDVRIVLDWPYDFMIELSEDDKQEILDTAYLCASVMPHEHYERLRAQDKGYKPPLPSLRSLKELCRAELYNAVPNRRMDIYVHHLPLPPLMKKFLLFE